jgi:hypothetical protein
MRAYIVKKNVLVHDLPPHPVFVAYHETFEIYILIGKRFIKKLVLHI